MATALHEELKQTRPYLDIEEEAHVAIARTAALLDRAIAQMLRPHGLTPTQYNVLRILRGAGRDGLPTLEIAARMVERTPGVTRLLDRLEQKGVVVRERSAEDRRQVFRRLTPAGTELLKSLDRAIDALDDGVLAALTKAELEELVRLLNKVRNSDALRR